MEKAAMAAGLSVEAGRALFADDCFADQAMAALTAAYRMLELEMLHRARFGTDDPKKYNDPHGLRMLIRHRAEQGTPPQKSAVTTRRLEQITARLRARLEVQESGGHTCVENAGSVPAFGESGHREQDKDTE